MKPSIPHVASYGSSEVNGPNPLLAPLGPKLIPNAPHEHCRDYLPLTESHFVPTPAVLNAIRHIHQLLQSGDFEHHPGGDSCMVQMHEIPSLPARGVPNLLGWATNAKRTETWSMTRVGKSATWMRTLSLLRRDINHGHNEFDDSLAALRASRG